MEIYNRADIVNFMNTGTAENPVWTRMQGFTEGGKSMNSSTYDRRYIDEKTERSDVVAYKPEIAYNFDRIVGNAVHEKLVAIHNNETTGASVEILTIDFKATTTGGYEARKRTYSVIPDASGDSTDAMTYSGSFSAAGVQTEGVASIGASYTPETALTATFVPEGSI